MLRPTAIKVLPLSDYKIHLEFDSGEKKIFDVAPYIQGNWYSELSDLAYFNSVFTNGFTVEWPHGQDLCPDEIYYNGTNVCEVLD